MMTLCMKLHGMWKDAAFDSERAKKMKKEHLTQGVNKRGKKH